MNGPLNIPCIAGSLRRQSYNRAALQVARQLVPENVTPHNGTEESAES